MDNSSTKCKGVRTVIVRRKTEIPKWINDNRLINTLTYPVYNFRIGCFTTIILLVGTPPLIQYFHFGSPIGNLRDYFLWGLPMEEEQ